MCRLQHDDGRSLLAAQPRRRVRREHRRRLGGQRRHRLVVIGGPEEGAGVIPCPALVGVGCGAIHVAYRLDDDELVRLAGGAALWLTTWGGLPVHLLEVTA